jgi:protein subunit release factor A
MELSSTQELAEAYQEYKREHRTIDDDLAMLDTESDSDMRELLKEELDGARKKRGRAGAEDKDFTASEGSER